MSKHIIYKDAHRATLSVGYNLQTTELYVIAYNRDNIKGDIAPDIDERWKLLRINQSEIGTTAGKIDGRVLPTSIALHMPEMWHLARDVFFEATGEQIPSSIMESITRAIMEEIRTEDDNLCKREVDWTNWMPIEVYQANNTPTEGI